VLCCVVLCCVVLCCVVLYCVVLFEFVLLRFGRLVDTGVWMALIFYMYCLLNCSEDTN
jgi:hypothetical protein